MLTIQDHQLRNTRFIQSPDRGGLITPTYIVVHYTGGGPAEGSIAWLSKPDDHYLSAHVVIDRDGSITQLVPFNRKAYHAGVSAWGPHTNLNDHSIGIEIANFGLATSNTATDAVFLNKYKLPKNRCINATHKNNKTTGWWEEYTDEQEKACAALCIALMHQYPGINEIVGHDDIAPNRKIDPGPAWDMPMLWHTVTQGLLTLDDSANGTGARLNDQASDGVSAPPKPENAATGIVEAPLETLLGDITAHTAQALRKHLRN